MFDAFLILCEKVLKYLNRKMLGLKDIPICEIFQLHKENKRRLVKQHPVTCSNESPNIIVLFVAV